MKFIKLSATLNWFTLMNTNLNLLVFVNLSYQISYKLIMEGRNSWSLGGVIIVNGSI